MRFLLIIAIFLFSFSLPAAALERPRLDVLGFSPDGRFFAYQQSGYDRGQVAFADLFVIDTKTDKRVSGSPIRIRYTPDQGDLAAARAALKAQSARYLKRLGLNRASAGVSYVPKTRTQMSLDLPWGERAQIKLETHDGMAAPGCPISVPVKKGAIAGLSLTMQLPEQVTVLYNDTMVPRGRGCPLSYRFASGFVKSRGSDAVIANVIAYQEATMRKDEYVTRYMAVTKVIKAPKLR